MEHAFNWIHSMITRDDVDRVFVYCESGALIRRSTGSMGYKRPDGYVYTRLMGRSYPEHRLIFLLKNGFLPHQVDHKNGIRSDNRSDNLRAATHSQNCMNRRKVGKFSKGCYWQPKRRKWISQIGFSGKRITIGYFDTEHEAAQAYENMSIKLHGEFGRTK